MPGSTIARDWRVPGRPHSKPLIGMRACKRNSAPGDLPTWKPSLKPPMHLCPPKKENQPVTELHIPLDPLNPGQFFACCGLLELFTLESAAVLGSFSSDPYRPRVAAFV